MECFIRNAVSNRELTSDIKSAIPDAALRRRMSRIVKTAVATAAECLANAGSTALPDAIITATGWGCIEDSERFLRNMITDREQLLNPTPFIQSTFNTVGGQIALLEHNHCYNVTYVNRSHGFEDALLDAMMRIADGESSNVLVGAFDERTPTQHKIMERMGLFRNTECGEGALFALLTAERSDNSIAKITKLDFPAKSLSKEECMDRYAELPDSVPIYNKFGEYGLYPTVSAMTFAKAVRTIAEGAKEVIVYNELLGMSPTITVLRCII